MSARPNVLIFCVDEMRAGHMACAGNPTIRTPNIDRLAGRGTYFPRAYCNNPICMPARASLFTGLLPRDHGLRINGQNLRTDLPTLPGVLADAGYRTHAAGKLHLTAWTPEALDPPRPDLYPECLAYWHTGAITDFPTPYYGFQSVDMVGGHTSFSFGPYFDWLKERGGDPAQLTPKGGRPSATGAPSTYKMGLPEALHYNRYIADSVIGLIQDSAADAAPPFFAWCSFPDPHAPIAPPAPYSDMYDPDDVDPPAGREGEVEDLPPVYRDVLSGKLRPNGCLNKGVTEAQWQEMIALTYGMVTHIDTEIGRVLDVLDATGQADNTILVLVADHGDMLGDHGLIWKSFYTFDGCIRIPMILAAPGMPGGQRSEALISQIDLMPSLLDLCNVPMPGSDWKDMPTTYERGSVCPLLTHPGHSCRGLLDGTAASIRNSVVIENDDPTMGFQARCLVTADHRLTVYPGTPDGELFDLTNDPRELHNLWYRPEHARLKATLTAKLLDAYSRDTPLYPIPPGNA